MAGQSRHRERISRHKSSSYSSRDRSPSSRNSRSPMSRRTPKRGLSFKQSLSFHVSDFIRKHSPRRRFEKDYILGELLGKGGFGAAYSCRHKLTGATRAVKILPKSNEETTKEAYEEFRLMAKLDHPNIAKIYEFYEDERNSYIIQDLYKGGDLFELVKRGTLTEYQTAVVINSLLRSVGYFHRQGLCHRDLKPENILLDDINAFHTARIIDFGLARYSEPDQPFTDILGSLEYVSPQVLKGSYGKPSDLWSIGVLAFVLLTGHAPFDGEDDQAVMEAIRQGQYEFHDAVWRKVSQECKEFIRSLLQYEEEDRPSAEQALQHRCLKQMRKLHQKEHNDQIQEDIQLAIDALERFRSRNSKLKQAACVLLATQFLHKSDRDRIDQVFRVLDRRCAGSLNAEDLHFAFWFTDITGETRSDEHIEGIVKEVNFSKSGSILYSEFAAVMMLEMGLIDTSRLGDLFEYFALGRYEIDWRDLKRVLFPHSSKREHTCRKMVAEATDDRSKVITFPDFRSIMFSNITHDKDQFSRRDGHPHLQ